MELKIVAVTGSYRVDGITEQTVDAVLAGAQSRGARTEKIRLMDQKIEFCTNCRICASDDSSKRRGKCVIQDDAERIFSLVDECDGLILAAPVNFGGVTAVMKRFVERMIAYGYWLWHQLAPKDRVRQLTKKAVVVTSSACPGFLARLIMGEPLKLLKRLSKLVGARVVDAIYFGGVCLEEEQRLTPRQKEKAFQAGVKLAR